MRVYTVHAPAGEPQPERFVFVKDGFSWPAFLIPILWSLWHRMWLTLIGYLVFAAVVIGIDRLTAGDFYATLVGLGGALILGLEGNTIRRLSLERRGWREVGETFGRNLSEAETRFFLGWTQRSPHERSALVGSASHAGGESAPESDEPILGLFPEPER